MYNNLRGRSSRNSLIGVSPHKVEKSLASISRTATRISPRTRSPSRFAALKASRTPSPGMNQSPSARQSMSGATQVPFSPLRLRGVSKIAAPASVPTNKGLYSRRSPSAKSPASIRSFLTTSHEKKNDAGPLGLIRLSSTHHRHHSNYLSPQSLLATPRASSHF